MKHPTSKRQIKRKFCYERPTIWIGKNGVSQQMLAEIDRQLEKTEVVKVRILRSVFTDEKVTAIASKITQSTKSALIEIRGHTIILHRKKNES